MFVDDLKDAGKDCALTLIVEESTVTLAVVDHDLGEGVLHQLIVDQVKISLLLMLLLDGVNIELESFHICIDE